VTQQSNDTPRTDFKLQLEDLSTEELTVLWQAESVEFVWDLSDLTALWQQQLDASIIADLSLNVAGDTLQFKSLCSDAVPPIATFRELLNHPSAPPHLLDAVRRWTKIRAAAPEGTGVGPIAGVLYYVTIAVGLRLAYPRPTKLTREALKIGFEWALEQGFLDAQTRNLLESARLRCIEKS